MLDKYLSLLLLLIQRLYTEDMHHFEIQFSHISIFYTLRSIIRTIILQFYDAL